MSSPSTALVVYQKVDLMNASVSQSAQDKPVTQTVVPCPTPWLFSVQLVSSEKDWPTSSAQMHLDSSSGDADQILVDEMSGINGSKFSINGQGPDTFIPNLVITGWRWVASKRIASIALPASDQKEFQFFIERNPWVGFQVKLADSTDTLPSVTFSVQLPGKNDSSSNNPAQFDNLNDGTASVVGIQLADNNAWEVTPG